MFSKIRQRAASEKGFTLIELLVVILIIGILAAIALPAFLAQRGKAQDTEAKSSARTAQTAMETFYTDEQDYSANAGVLKTIEPALNDGQSGLTLAVNGGDVGDGEAGYSVAVTSKTGNTFTITKTGAADADAANPAGAVKRTCATAGKAGCNKAGTW
jgi:type IV pilus assembly protein PilA